jgi:uncharacterized protein (TIGR03084 family)
MEEIVEDLQAEQTTLDGLVSPLTEEQWQLATPAKGWDIRDSINHLRVLDELALECVEGRGEAAWKALRQSSHPQKVNNSLIEPFRNWTTEAVLARWRKSREELNKSLLGCKSDQRILWGDGPMAARSLATARLMECWAHGLDCFAAVGLTPVDTKRIRHICHLGYRALPYAFRLHQRQMPAPLEDLRLELSSPEGERWVFGPQSASQLVSGAAGEWARVAVKRLSYTQATSLRARGSLAQQALEVAQAYLAG